MHSSKDQAKADLERRQFSHFLEMMAVDHIMLDIESRNNPEPDICFQNRIAFELTEICPPEVAHANAKLIKAGGGVKAVYPSDVAAKQLNEKLNKNYVSTLPIELLCFSSSRSLWPDDHIIYQMRLELDAHQKIQFRRIWYCGETVVAIHNPENLGSL
jgi:hypothetical protein